MKEHVMVNVPKGFERLGGSAETAQKNHASPDMPEGDKIKVEEGIPNSGSDSVKRTEEASMCLSTASQNSEIPEGKVL